MPWKHNGRIIQENKAWVADNNSKHPRTWSSWSLDYKKANGLVWEDPPASPEPFDEKFYWGRQANGTLIERSLVDVNVVDSEDKAVIDPKTGKQAVQLGLKSIWISRTKERTKDLLSKSDWEVTRKAEKGTGIATATSTYRDKVRTACDTIETKINNCSKLSEFITLFDLPKDSDGKVTGNAPIFDFPKES